MHSLPLIYAAHSTSSGVQWSKFIQSFPTVTSPTFLTL